MNERLSRMLPSVYVGRLWQTDVRISLWFILVPLILCPRYGYLLGFTFLALLYASVFLHEFAHVFMARWTGGFADEIHLTPIGGIAPAKPGPGARSLGSTAAAGPFVNLFICLLTYPKWYAPAVLYGVLNPFVMPIAEIRSAEMWQDLGVLLFFVNWMALLVNLLPVAPLDGGHILRAILSGYHQANPEHARRTALWVGIFVSFTLLAAGAIFDISQLVLVGTFVLLVNVVQLMQDEMGERTDDSTFGYDFSAGYESLERSSHTSTREAKQGLLQQWRERRRERRELQERQRIQEAEQQLDLLLAKVHESGMQSLSEQEKKLLRSCSELLSNKNKATE